MVRDSERWEGEVCFRGMIASVIDTHLTPLAALAPSPPQARAEREQVGASD